MIRFLQLLTGLILCSAPVHSAAQYDNNAPVVSAARLQRMCAYYTQVVSGATDGHDAARQCDMYMRSFIDSSMLYSRFTGARFFCMRGSPTPADMLPALDVWIRKYPDKAERATAAVALADALRIAYPCPSR